MRTGIELSTSRLSARTGLLGVIALAAVALAVALILRSGGSTEPVNADTAAAPLSAPASAGYIKIGDIKGESTDNSHKDWIDLLSVSQSITRPMSGGISGSTRQRGSVVFGDVVVVKELDKSSPKLQEFIAKGQVLPLVTLDMTTQSTGTQFTYLKYELKNVQVTNYRVSGSSSGDPLPTETISLNFEEIKVTYTEQGADGTSRGNVEYSWKVEEGTN